jgi:hypothetical protein
MRILVFVMIMLISACASNAPGNLQGNIGKADRTVVYKHLDADPNYILTDSFQCRINSVLVCSVGQGKSDCNCQTINDVEDREARMLNRGERGAGARSRRHRQ